MNLNSIDFNKLAVFSQIVEAGNYRRASEILNVSPSALSQTITTLEHGLGIRLFHRFGKKLVLTEEGVKIQREFKKFHAGFGQSLLQIAGSQSKVSGLLQIGSYMEFAKFQLASIVARFQKSYPDVQIKFVFDTPSRLHRLLEANKIDVCFSIFPERDSKLILSKPIYKEELLLVSLAGMLSPRAGFREVLSAPMIEYYFNHQPIRRWFKLHYKKKPKKLPIRTYGATAEMVLTLIQEGLGIGVVPEYLLRTQLPDSLIVCRPTNRKLVDHIWMLQLKNHRQSPALEAFTSQTESDFQLL